MSQFESLFSGITKDPRWMQKLLIGGLISCVPVFNLLAMGYLYRFAKSRLAGGNVSLPEWKRWDLMALSGLKFLAVGLTYMGLPVLAGWFVTQLFGGFSEGIMGRFASLPFSVGLLVGSSLFALGLFGFCRTGKWEVLLGFPGFWRVYTRCWHRLLVPCLLFWGIVYLGFPLYGFAFFIAFLALILYAFDVFLSFSNH